MGMAFTLRNTGRISYFKEIMIGLLERACAEEAFLGTGYVSEYNTFKVSEEKNSYCGKKKSTIVEALPKNFKLTTLGVMISNNSISVNMDDNYKSYARFIKTILNKRSDVKVTPFFEKSGKWHAKVFLLLKDKKVIAGIIGSSNMTKKAFASPIDIFNYESDVIIWDDSLDLIISKIFEGFSEKSGLMRAIYVPEEEGDTETKRLQIIYEGMKQKLNKDEKAINSDGIFEIEM